MRRRLSVAMVALVIVAATALLSGCPMGSGSDGAHRAGMRGSSGGMNNGGGGSGY